MNLRTLLRLRDEPDTRAAIDVEAVANTKAANIDAQNTVTLRRIREFRAQGGSFHEFNQLKHKFPYFGLVPCRAGSIDFVLFHANDDQIAWEYQWFGPDKYETKIVQTWLSWCSRPGTVLDIGAYTGLMAILAALANNKTTVHLFEPTPRTIERAKMNIRVNGLTDRINLHNKAVSNAAGTAKINLYREENFVGSGNSLFDKGKPIYDTKNIELVAIDSYTPGIHPTVVKIDVEGHELQCLQGMLDTIERSRPRMLIEIWEHNRKTVLSMLTDLGYHYAPFEEQERRVMNYRCEPA